MNKNLRLFILKLLSVNHGGGYKYIYNNIVDKRLIKRPFELKDIKKEIQIMKVDLLLETHYLFTDESELRGRGFLLTEKGNLIKIEIEETGDFKD